MERLKAGAELTLVNEVMKNDRVREGRLMTPDGESDLDTFDMLSSAFDRSQTPATFQRWHEEVGLMDQFYNYRRPHAAHDAHDAHDGNADAGISKRSVALRLGFALDPPGDRLSGSIKQTNGATGQKTQTVA